MQFRSTILASTVVIALCGCGSAAPTQRSTLSGRTAAAMHNTNHRHRADGCMVTAVYFDFDSSELDIEARDTLEGDAHCLVRHDAAARVTGLTDPRGTEEYNLALGDRRARIVAQYMSNLGVDRGKLSFSSLGEETAMGEEEVGWALDRRADIQLR